MSSNTPEFQQQIAEVLRQLGDGETTLETARSLLWSILKGVSDSCEEVDRPTPWEPRGHFLNNSESTDFFGSLQESSAFPLPPPSIRSMEKRWTTQIKFVPQSEQNAVCFEVIVDCLTPDSSRTVMEIAQSAKSYEWPKDLNIDSESNASESPFVFSLVTESNTSQKTEILRREHRVVFRIRDRFPLDSLVKRLTWPPPASLMHQWNEDLEKLSAWFHDNALPLTSFRWDDLWIARDGKLTLPTWPVNVAEAMIGSIVDHSFSPVDSLADLQTRSSGDRLGAQSLLALRDELFIAASLDACSDTIGPNKSQGDSAAPFVQSNPKVESIAGAVAKKVHGGTASSKKLWVAARLVSASIVLLFAAWGMTSWGVNESLSDHQIKAALEAPAPKAIANTNLPDESLGTQRIASKPILDDPTDTSIHERLSIAYPEPRTPELSAETHQGSSEFSLDLSDLPEADVLKKTMPLVAPAFFENITAADFASTNLKATMKVARDGFSGTDSSPGTEPLDASKQTKSPERNSEVSFANPDPPLKSESATPEPMIVPAIPIRVQLEPDRRTWELNPDWRYQLRQMKSSINLYNTPDIEFIEMRISSPSELNQNPFTQYGGSSGSPSKLLWTWVVPINESEGRSHRGLVEFRLSELAQERLRVRLDVVHMGNELECTCSCVATWDGGFSWHSLSPNSVRATREQLASRAIQLDNQLAQVKSSYSLAVSSEERTLIRNHRKHLEDNARLFETLNARLGELEKLVALVELHGALVVEVIAPVKSPGTDSETEVNSRPVTLFHSNLRPELTQDNPLE